MHRCSVILHPTESKSWPNVGRAPVSPRRQLVRQRYLASFFKLGKMRGPKNKDLRRLILPSVVSSAVLLVSCAKTMRARRSSLG